MRPDPDRPSVCQRVIPEYLYPTAGQASESQPRRHLIQLEMPIMFSSSNLLRVTRSRNLNPAWHPPKRCFRHAGQPVVRDKVSKRSPGAVATGDQDSEHYATFSLANFAPYGPVALALVGARFTRRSDILGAGPLQDFLRLLGPLGAVGVDGEQDPAVFDAAFVPFGFIFRDSHSNEGSRDPADRTPPPRPCDSRHNRACGDKRS